MSALADEVYRRLREEIVTGRLRPRDLLVEVDLAQRLAVSRTPVRESLHRLAAEGLIASHRRRWVVHEHTSAQIAEVYEVRAALEGLAARLAAQRATPQQRSAVRGLLDVSGPDGAPRTEAAAGEYADSAGNDWFVTVNARFHTLVAEAAHNANLARLIEQNRLYTFNLRVAARYSPADIAASQAEHRAIWAAVEAGDGDAAELAARGHVRNALDLIVATRAPADGNM